MNWQVQQAKARFSEFLDQTLKEGPQTVTRHGKPVAVMVPADEYNRLKTKGKSIKELLTSAPLQGLKITRSREKARVVDLDD